MGAWTFVLAGAKGELPTEVWTIRLKCLWLGEDTWILPRVSKRNKNRVTGAQRSTADDAVANYRSRNAAPLLYPSSFARRIEHHLWLTTQPILKRYRCGQNQLEEGRRKI